ncbi:hypothetical protein EVAR_79849_1 [Eumeta japonica]|uniref:Uncharacterized protein n=1 Tax=Eumeta variegata TaxID=151549 RepID=A0A4C1TZ37_EUMVA|nr:hypothetical protein EVAR_79849_1 [Eumeta japonica]
MSRCILSLVHVPFEIINGVRRNRAGLSAGGSAVNCAAFQQGGNREHFKPRAPDVDNTPKTTIVDALDQRGGT